MAKPAPMTKPPTPETQLYTATPPVANALRFAFVYPANYAVSVSALGYLLLFALADQLPTVAATRITTDNLAQHHGQDYHVVGFSFAFELDILAILDGLEGLHIPLLAADRADETPLVFAGGPVPTTNPEPYADFFDFFLVGDGETLLPDVLNHLYTLQTQHPTMPRLQVLTQLAATYAGVYVPALYAVSYEDATGPITHITPLSAEVPAMVQRATVANMDAHVAASPILSDQSVYGYSYLVEVRRGCAHRCRFCLASYSTLPAKSAGIEALWQKIEQGLQHTDHIGLLGALIADHPAFDQLCDRLNAVMDTGRTLRVSCSSLRVDTLTPAMLAMFVRAQQQQITLAIESGSPKVRTAIHKHLSQDAIFKAAEMVQQAGMPGLKLYTMVGLPTETEDDVAQTIELARALKKAHPKLKLTLGSSSFVPKAATPFQWLGRMPDAVLEQRIATTTKGLRNVAQYRPSSVKWDTLQALLSRGDRRLAPFLLLVRQFGGSAGSFNRAYKQLQCTLPSLDWYARRERPQAECLPWNRLHLGVDSDILWQEGQTSLQRAESLYS
jgi:radical SAM superfamily enzyme YgiQ (UPF0313 family)